MRSPSTLLALLFSLWSLVAFAQATPQHAPVQPALVNRTPAPQPSRRMGLKSRSPADGKKGQQILSSGGRKDYSAFLCPDNAIACPIPASGAVLAGVKEDELVDLATWFKVGFECIEPLEELSSCGGCISLSRGQDCTAIPNTRDVSCDQGLCVVQRCKQGHVVGSDGKSCVKSGRR